MIQSFRHFVLRQPSLVDYRIMINTIWQEQYDSRDDVAPVIIPQWDHSPRSGLRAASIYVNATPSNFEKLAINVLSRVKKKKNKIVMLKSWNEWAEGNFMEPDLKYGRGFIEALGKAVETTKELK